MCARKLSQQDLLSADLQPDKVHQKWYKLTEVNGAYKHGSYDRNVGWKKVCIVHPVLKFLPHKMAGQPAGQTELTTYFMLLIWINKTTKQNHKFKYACIWWSKDLLLIKKEQIFKQSMFAIDFLVVTSLTLSTIVSATSCHFTFAFL